MTEDELRAIELHAGLPTVAREYRHDAPRLVAEVRRLRGLKMVESNKRVECRRCGRELHVVYICAWCDE